MLVNLGKSRIESNRGSTSVTATNDKVTIGRSVVITERCNKYVKVVVIECQGVNKTSNLSLSVETSTKLGSAILGSYCLAVYQKKDK